MKAHEAKLKQPKPTNRATPAQRVTEQPNQAVNIFDVNDPRIRVVYFGFTRCPDVCPTSLAMLAGALNQIDKAQLIVMWACHHETRENRLQPVPPLREVRAILRVDAGGICAGADDALDTA